MLRMMLNKMGLSIQPKPKPKVDSVEQMKEERKHARDIEARKLTDIINTDYFD